MKALALEDNEWMADAVATIIGLSLDGEFTADDLRREMRPPASDKWPGLAFGLARRKGLIEKVSETTSKAKSRNHGSLKVWRRVSDGIQS